MPPTRDGEDPGTRGEVLVAIMNDPRDLAIARDEHWYRIPVASVRRRLRKRWPPRWLAFYQTKVFGREAFAVNYYAPVIRIRQVRRLELFPLEQDPERRQRRYYQLMLGPLVQRTPPIISHRWRRIVFLPTTWHKFNNAVEINDLYDESPLEDALWARLKHWRIAAERQELVTVHERNYFLDFAIYCGQGSLDVETDGDTYHATPDRVPGDNLRDNDLGTVGWRVLRFNTYRIREEADSYCLPTIVENVNRLGGLDEGRAIPRKVDPRIADGVEQLGLFDDRGDAPGG